MSFYDILVGICIGLVSGIILFMFDLYMFVKIIKKQDEMMEAGAQRASNLIRTHPDYVSTQQKISSLESSASSLETSVTDLRSETKAAVDNMNHTVDTTVASLQSEIQAVRTEMGSTRDDVAQTLRRVEDRIDRLNIPSAGDIADKLEIEVPTAKDIAHAGRAMAGQDGRQDADEFEKELTDVMMNEGMAQDDYDKYYDIMIDRGVSPKIADAAAYRIAIAPPKKRVTLIKRAKKMMKDHIPGGAWVSDLL